MLAFEDLFRRHQIVGLMNEEQQEKEKGGVIAPKSFQFPFQEWPFKKESSEDLTFALLKSK